ncbi:MAG: glucosamine-6-phosphate deaminase [Anaerolineae bacterium]|nr:glucosamine-6-phosphate deaminase [Anaerolineae bacterium]
MLARPIAVRVARYDRLRVEIFPTRDALGRAAAHDVAERMRLVLTERAKLRMVFAAAPSQNEFLAALREEPALAWERVEAFHMDEYVGLGSSAPQSFGCFLRERLFDQVRPGRVEYLNGEAPNPQAECARYAALLQEAPLDIICAGIGENGHMAFNDPHVADFQDPQTVKLVQMDQICRLQQVHDGAFPDLESVPTKALTMTMPALMSGRRVYCMVPGPTKTEAVRRTCIGEISEACPATLMRRHAQTSLYLDRDSAAGL